MTLPTRPAPAPPGSRAQNAAANANASLEQLRLQLQQQQQQQQLKHSQLQQQEQKNVFAPKLTIKLPPPPKHPVTSAAANAHYDGSITNNNTSSITRKFPQARYAPATNWDDSPFDILAGGNGGGCVNATVAKPITTNGNYKKQPPPRPPPPKVLSKKSVAPTPPPQQSTNILTNIFHLKKKSSRTLTTNNTSSRIYGSATYGTTTATTAAKTTTSTLQQSAVFGNSSSLSTDWNSAWNNAPNFGNTTTQQQTANTEAQLISFDSPPSSPTFTQKSNSDCLSVDSFSSDSNFSSPNNGSVSQPESGFEDDFTAGRSRPATTSPLDPWETLDAFGHQETTTTKPPRYGSTIGTAPVRNLSTINTRLQSNGDNPLCNGKNLLPQAPALNAPTIIKPKISLKPKAPKPPLLARPFASLNSATICSDNFTTPPSPPMPQCAPPPLPPLTQPVLNSTSSFPAVPAAGPNVISTQKSSYSILDVITGKVDAIQLSSGPEDYGSGLTEPPHGIALYDFDSTEEGDLCFRENEKLYIIEQVSADWFKGRTRSGCEGIFPANYIEIKVPLPSKTVSSANSSTQSSSASTTPTYQAATKTTAISNNLKVRSLYNFPAEIEGDLELKENDLVTILHRINEDWLFGEVSGRQGQFPANFLEHVPSNIPMP